ncbi:hypothetical protein E2P86_01410 [Sphingobacterium psychroaquaticum]|uniref:S41 family peptidase n=1 Tax=Sphingobacterium psychroaquaticum TaxID=561061 RepID=UPI00106901C1|nr:hypothetical protein E2P86_01410 [Sphingobacterium psychroaquaticum]
MPVCKKECGNRSWVPRSVFYEAKIVNCIESLWSFFLYTNGCYRSPNKIYPFGERYKGKVIVLVNENTQSCQEYITMALKAVLNTTILDNASAGANGNMTSFTYQEEYLGE